MFDIDDVLTLTALLPVVTMDMDTHTRTQTNTHTHTCKGVAATTCKTLHCTVVRCVGANAYNGHSYFGQLKQKAEERERERERCSTSQCPIGDHRGQCSGRVQLESLSAVCVLALYSDFLLARQRK